jgi:hypothetical protein
LRRRQSLPARRSFILAQRIDGTAEHADPAKGAGYVNIGQIQIKSAQESSLSFLRDPDFNSENLL